MSPNIFRSPHISQDIFRYLYKSPDIITNHRIFLGNENTLKSLPMELASTPNTTVTLQTLQIESIIVPRVTSCAKPHKIRYQILKQFVTLSTVFKYSSF